MTFEDWWKKRQSEIKEILLEVDTERIFALKAYFENAWLHGKYVGGKD